MPYIYICNITHILGFMKQIFSDLEQKIEKLFTQDDLAALNDPAPSLDDNDNRLFLPTSKLLMLIFRIKALNINSAATPPPSVVEDINAPILDGMYPLHLALLTPCTPLLDHLIVQCGANPNVKCSDANSPFYGMTPLEMALHLMRYTQTKLHCMFYDACTLSSVMHFHFAATLFLGLLNYLFST